jgi:formate dehydrogenase iron-sulfur subunit
MATDFGVAATLAPSHAVGFLTDASLCIGCKACEVACKQWNELPADDLSGRLSGHSYDNTLDLGATTWRHVAFVEREAPATGPAWLMLSDVCKHCVHAGCMEACPTGAIIRTEFDTVYIQPDICNGCGYCVPACPFGVPQIDHEAHISRKCTLCYDRLRDGLEPACAKACPTDSIRFGPVAELMADAAARVETLRERGVAEAQIYGDLASGGTNGIGGLNAIFVLTAAPETFNLPTAPALPADRALPAYLSALTVAAGLLGAAALAFGRRR